jgi:hypothetical protein
MTGSYNCCYRIGSIISSCATREEVSTLRPTKLGSFLRGSKWFALLLCGYLFSTCLKARDGCTLTGSQTRAKEILIKYHGEGDANNAFLTFQLHEFEEQLELTDKSPRDYRGLFKSRADIYRLGCNLVYSCWGQLSSGGIAYFVRGFYASAGITSPTTIFNFNISTSVLNTILSFYRCVSV